MAIDPAIAAVLGIDSGSDQKGLMEAAKASNLLAQNTPGANGLNQFAMANGLGVSEVSVAAFEKMMEGSVAAQTIAGDYASKEQKKAKAINSSSNDDDATLITSGDVKAESNAVSDPAKMDLYAQNEPGSGARQGRDAVSTSSQRTSQAPDDSPIVVSVGGGTSYPRPQQVRGGQHGKWPSYVSESPLVNPNNIIRDINNLVEGNGGVENPANVFRAQVMLMQAEVQWNLVSQMAAKGVSGIQTLFSNQI